MTTHRYVGIAHCPVPGCGWYSDEMDPTEATRAYIDHLERVHEAAEPEPRCRP